MAIQTLPATSFPLVKLRQHVKPENREHTTPRGMVRFIVPLTKSLLCNPMPRQKNGHAKKSSHSDAVSAATGQPWGTKTKKCGSDSSLDQQAAALLMKASGVLGDSEQPSESTKQQFSEKFVTPLETGLVGDMRVVLGLPEDGGADRLSALVMPADVEADA